jgi:hypothetical protein
MSEKVNGIEWGAMISCYFFLRCVAESGGGDKISREVEGW